MPFNLGAPELMIIMVIVLIVFGAGKLPNVMKDLGTGVREFKKAQTEEEMASTPSAMHASTAAAPAQPGASTTATTSTVATPAAPAAPAARAITETAPRA